MHSLTGVERGHLPTPAEPIAPPQRALQHRPKPCTYPSWRVLLAPAVRPAGREGSGPLARWEPKGAGKAVSTHSPSTPLGKRPGLVCACTAHNHEALFCTTLCLSTEC